MSVPFATYPGYSDTCALADGTLCLGRWSATGLTDNVILQVYPGYTQQDVGAIGPVAVIKLAGVNVEAMTCPEGTVRGVISLHPDGWALVQVDDATLALWQLVGAAWAEVARVTLPAGGTTLQNSNDQFSGTGATAYIGPGTLRLEVINGDLWALHAAAVNLPQYVLRGSALVPSTSLSLSSLPVSVQQVVQAGVGTWRSGATTAVPFAALWRNGWWQTGAAPNPTTLQNTTIEGVGSSLPWFLIAADPAVPMGTLTYEYALSDVQLTGAAPYCDLVALYGAQLRVVAGQDMPDPLIAEWMRYDGQQVYRNLVNCLPLTGRQSNGSLWMLGLDAAAIAAQAPKTLQTGITGDLGSYEYFGGFAEWPQPTALYTLGAPDPAQGCVVWGTSAATDGFYGLYTGTGYDAVYLSADGQYEVIFNGTNWILIATPGVTVSGTGTDLDQVYTPDGTMDNGKPVYLSADGQYEILFNGTDWVLVAVDAPDIILAEDGSGPWPSSGAWTTLGILTVSGAGDTAVNQDYIETAEVSNGYPVYVSADGLYEIWFNGTDWVLTTVADPSVILYQDGSGDSPVGGTWTDVTGTGAAPTVVLDANPTVTADAPGTTLFEDGTGLVPWTPEGETVVEPPVEGEVILYETRTITGLATAARVTLAGGLAAQTGKRALVRGEGASPPAVDDWTTYQACPFGATVTLTVPAATVRVAIIAEAGSPRPGVDLQVFGQASS